MSNLKQLEHLLLKARKKQIELDVMVDEIHKLLDNLQVNLEGSTEAENAISLDEAITCYIQYNEYDITNIIKEIKGNMTSEEILYKK